MPDEFLGTKALRATFPSLSNKVLRQWSRRCGPLGRAVGTKPHPEGRGWSLYSAADVRKAVESYGPGPAPDQFTDARGTRVWRSRMADPPDAAVPWVTLHYGVMVATLSHWRDRGCAALGGGKMVHRRRWFAGQSKPRDYVRVEDLDAVKRFRPQVQPPPADADLIPLVDAARILPTRFLRRFCYAGAGQRKVAVMRHPALGPGDGRTIYAVNRAVTRGGRVFRAVFVSRQDCVRVRDWQMPAAWLPLHRVRSEYGLTDRQVMHLVRRGDLHPTAFPVCPPRSMMAKGTAGRQASRRHLLDGYPVAELEVLAGRRTPGPAATPPVGGKQRRGRPKGPVDRHVLYRQVMSAWVAFKAHGDKKQFVADRARDFPGLTLAVLERARKWVAKYGQTLARRPGTKSPASP